MTWKRGFILMVTLEVLFYAGLWMLAPQSMQDTVFKCADMMSGTIMEEIK